MGRRGAPGEWVSTAVGVSTVRELPCCSGLVTAAVLHSLAALSMYPESFQSGGIQKRYAVCTSSSYLVPLCFIEMQRSLREAFFSSYSCPPSPPHTVPVCPGLRLQYGVSMKRPLFWPQDVPWVKGKPLSMMNHAQLSSIFAAM